MMGEWQRLTHEEQVWGTVVTFDLRGPVLDPVQASRAVSEAAEELHRIDAWLSPFRADSAVSALRLGRLTAASVPDPVKEVLDGCLSARTLSSGAFNPWKAPGGFDPSGYVKGWGADRAAQILLDHGFANVSVNAAGDVTCRGQASASQPGWRIGISDPRDRSQVITSVDVVNAHLATSGRYEQGDHVIDPRTGHACVHVNSASVLASDGGLADALATALMVSGPQGFTALGHLGISAYLVVGSHVWTLGDGLK
jgi:thiamine biosynthesis lipoprotein